MTSFLVRSHIPSSTSDSWQARAVIAGENMKRDGKKRTEFSPDETRRVSNMVRTSGTMGHENYQAAGSCLAKTGYGFFTGALARHLLTGRRSDRIFVRADIAFNERSLFGRERHACTPVSTVNRRLGAST